VLVGNQNATINNSTVTNWGGGFYYYEGEITLPGDLSDIQSSDGSVDITLKVGNSTATTKIWVSIPNSPPVFTQELPETLTLNKGDSYTFEVSAYDPEGEDLTYEWYVKYGTKGNYEKQDSITNTLTYTFSNAGTYWVKCVVKDTANNTAETVSVVTVNAPETSGKIILHLGIGGVYVSRHDPNNGFQIIKTKQTDDTGTVEFDNVNGYAWLSLAFTPDMYLSGKMLEESKEEMFEELAEEIQETYNMTEVPDCLDVDKLQQFAQQNPPNVNNYSGNLTTLIQNSDTDDNGCLDKEELWEKVIVPLFDADHDGKLTIKELNQSNNETNMDVEIVFVTIPEGEYYLPFGEDEGWEEKEVQITVKNVPYGTGINVYGPFWSYKWLENWENYGETVDLNGTLYLDALQPTNGKYSLIFTDNTNKKFYYLLDLDQDAVAVDYNDFMDMSPITLSGYNETQTGWINFSGVYANTLYQEADFVMWEENTPKLWVANIPEFDYYILQMEKEEPNETSSIRKEVRAKFDQLPTTIDFTDDKLKYLDVTISPDPDNANTYLLNGTDVNLINEWTYDYWLDVSNNNTYYWLSVFIANLGAPQNNQIVIPDWRNNLPDAVTSYVSQIETAAQSALSTYEDREVDIAYYPEYANATMKDLFNMHVNVVTDEIIPAKEVKFEFHPSTKKRRNKRFEPSFRIIPSIKIDFKKLLDAIF